VAEEARRSKAACKAVENKRRRRERERASSVEEECRKREYFRKIIELFKSEKGGKDCYKGVALKHAIKRGQIEGQQTENHYPTVRKRRKR